MSDFPSYKIADKSNFTAYKNGADNEWQPSYKNMVDKRDILLNLQMESSTYLAGMTNFKLTRMTCF